MLDSDLFVTIPMVTGGDEGTILGMVIKPSPLLHHHHYPFDVIDICKLEKRNVNKTNAKCQNNRSYRIQLTNPSLPPLSSHFL